MSDYWSYESCGACSGKAQPGTVDLLKYLMNRFPGTYSLGVYNCRLPSLHSCGKALDLGIPLLDGKANTALGDPIVIFLDQYANEFGLMGQIWNRVRYDLKTPRGRVYTGPHPHHDHDHVEQRLWHAQRLRYADYVRIAGPAVPIGGSTLLPISKTSPSEDIKLLQDHLNFQVVTGETPLKVDGDYGPNTTAFAKKKVGSLGLTPAQQAGTEIGYRQWNHIEHKVIMAWVGSSGDVTKGDLAAAIKAHAETGASATIHPHRHDEGRTGLPAT